MELQQLPPGFRFHPTDEELVSYYLCRKCAGLPLAAPVVAEVDLYRFDPWQLPEKAATGGGGEKEWYFFSPRDRKYPNGSRPNRSAGTGYWKATGADKPVGSPRTLAIKKALVFYAGKPAGPRAAVKTNWIMHEYRLADVDRSAAARKRTNHNNNNALRLDDWVLCRIYNKKGVIERYDTVDDDEGDGDGVKPRAAAAAVPGRTTARGNTASAAGGGGAAAAGMMKVEVPDEYGSYCYDNYDDLVGTPAAEMLCFDRSFLPPVPADHDRRGGGSSGDSARHATTPTAAAADNSSCGSEHVLSPSPELPDRDHAESQPGGGAAGWFDGCGGGGWGGGCAEYDGFVVVDDGGALFGPPPPPLPSPALFTSRDAATLAEMLAYLQRPF